MRAHLAPAKRDAEVPEKNAPTQRAEKGRVENTAPVRIPTFFFSLSVIHSVDKERLHAHCTQRMHAKLIETPMRFQRKNSQTQEKLTANVCTCATMRISIIINLRLLATTA